MCLLLFQYGGSKFPFILCSNRDEALFRHTSRGLVRDSPNASSRYYAPIDEEAGGTWIAFSEHNSRFAVVLNYHEWRKPKSAMLRFLSQLLGAKKQRSRGYLPLDFVKSAENISAESYANEISALPSGSYSGFNFIVGDRNGCYFVSNQSDDPRPLYLDPGVVHGISNGGINDDWCKVRISKARVERILTEFESKEDVNGSDTESEAQEVTSQLMEVMHDGTLLSDPTVGYLIEWYTKASAIFVNPMLNDHGKIADSKDNFGTRTTTIAVIRRDGLRKAHSLRITENDLDAHSSNWNSKVHTLPFSILS